jgi:hypothetical protein
MGRNKEKNRVAKKRRENKQENRTDGEMRVCKKKKRGAIDSKKRYT